MDLLENINSVVLILLLITNIFYFITLSKIKKERKLTFIEISMYILIQAAYLLLAFRLLLGILSK